MDPVREATLSSPTVAWISRWPGAGCSLVVVGTAGPPGNGLSCNKILVSVMVEIGAGDKCEVQDTERSEMLGATELKDIWTIGGTARICDGGMARI